MAGSGTGTARASSSGLLWRLASGALDPWILVLCALTAVWGGLWHHVTTEYNAAEQRA